MALENHASGFVFGIARQGGAGIGGCACAETIAIIIMISSIHNQRPPVKRSGQLPCYTESQGAACSSELHHAA